MAGSPLAAEISAKSGLDRPAGVNVVVAYHAGAFPTGMTVRLPRTPDDDS